MKNIFLVLEVILGLCIIVIVYMQLSKVDVLSGLI